tara:strand:- start:268 stop:396 length:129 start_codon:yes stop_codon:yes gene_type:complete
MKLFYKPLLLLDSFIVYGAAIMLLLLCFVYWFDVVLLLLSYI